MTMNEFYEKHKTNKYDFASVAGVGHRSLVKYAEGQPIREATKARIEKAMRIAEKYDLVRPEYDYSQALFWGNSYKHEFYRKVHEYEERFKRLLEEES